MFNLFSKLCRLNKNLFNYHGALFKLLKYRKLCSFENKSKKLIYFHKQRKTLNEIQLIQYERKFLEQRHTSLQLSAIKAVDYRKWLAEDCDNCGQTSADFNYKYRKIQNICRIYNEILDKTFRVPTQLTTYSMVDLLELDSDNDITNQINYLYETEMKRWTEKELRREEVLQNKEKHEIKYKDRVKRIGLFDDKNQLVYGLWHNTLFTRIIPKAKRNYLTRTRLKTSSMFGQKIIIDFGFEEYLNKISSKQLMTYLIKTVSFNKFRLEEPFDIDFCNLNKSGFCMKLIDNYFNEHNLIEYYINLKTDSYLNHFDFADLCYICPQADEPLRQYDHNAVYILPGVVNNRMDPPLSLMRVKREGIQMKRIPVEDMAPLREGTHIELHHCLQVLSHLRDYNNNMSEALELYLPKKFLKHSEEIEDEDQTVVKKLFYNQMIGSQKKAKVYRPVDY